MRLILRFELIRLKTKNQTISPKISATACATDNRKEFVCVTIVS